ncbi:MAG: mismatch-specific DNA-glycosylase [Egibacteraceae bacterium]
MGVGTRLLFVGINPGLRSAQLGQHFAGRSNRFWPALAASGLVPEGFGCQDQGRLPELGLGITNLVARPTARADQLDAAELMAGAARLLAQLDKWRGMYDIRVCAMLGITAYRVAFRCPKAVVGARPASGRPRWWVLHNPSGLNAHARLPDHVAGLKAAAAGAGLLVS